MLEKAGEDSLVDPDAPTWPPLRGEPSPPPPPTLNCDPCARAVVRAQQSVKRQEMRALSNRWVSTDERVAQSHARLRRISAFAAPETGRRRRCRLFRALVKKKKKCKKMPAV